MKIKKYAAVIAVAISLCAAQCRGLTDPEWQAWVKKYLPKNVTSCDAKCWKPFVGQWLKDWVLPINDNAHKKFAASYLFWEMRAQDALIVRSFAKTADAEKVAWKAFNGAFTAALACEGAAEPYGNVVEAVDWAFIMIPIEKEGKNDIRPLYESLYVALWNSDKDSDGKTFGDRVLEDKVVSFSIIATGYSRGQKFVKPVDGKVAPLYP